LLSIANKIKSLSTSGKLKTSESPEIIYCSSIKSSHSEEAAFHALAFLLGINFTPASPESIKGAFYGLQFGKNNTESFDAYNTSLDQLRARWEEILKNIENQKNIELDLFKKASEDSLEQTSAKINDLINHV